MCQESQWICKNCGEESLRSLQRGMCPKCYRFWQRHGVMRSAKTMSRLPPDSNQRSCKNCHEGKAVARELCATCWNYQKRTGRRRPRYLWQDACVNCGKPSTGQRSLCKGRCKNCYYWWHKYGEDRKIESVRWCDCGHKATHFNVPLQLLTVSNKVLTTELYDLCDDCWDLEHEPVQTRGENHKNR